MAFRRLLALFCLTALAAVPALAQTAATTNIEGTVERPDGRGAARRHGPDPQPRHQQHARGGDRLRGPLPRGRAPAGPLRGHGGPQRAGRLPRERASGQVGETVTVDVTMRAAGVAEEVTVTGEAPLIDTTRTDVSNVVSETAIQNLPINGRRWENFVLLSPGVTNDGNFGLVSYRGISGLYNNNTVDGVDNNQAFFSEARGPHARGLHHQPGRHPRVPGRGQQLLGRVRPRRRRDRERGDQVGHQRAPRRGLLLPARRRLHGPRAVLPQERREARGAPPPVRGRHRRAASRRTRSSTSSTTTSSGATSPTSSNFQSATFLDQACTAPGCAATRDVLPRGDPVARPPRGQQPHPPRQGRLRPEPVAHAVPAVQPPPLGRPQRRAHPGPQLQRAHRQRHRHREDRLRPPDPELGVQPDPPQRAAHPGRPRLRAAAPERARARHVGHGRVRLRDAELPAPR